MTSEADGDQHTVMSEQARLPVWWRQLLAVGGNSDKRWPFAYRRNTDLQGGVV